MVLFVKVYVLVVDTSRVVFGASHKRSYTTGAQNDIFKNNYAVEQAKICWLVFVVVGFVGFFFFVCVCVFFVCFSLLFAGACFHLVGLFFNLFFYLTV